MPVFSLTREIVFPPPELADEDGLLAVGGDLSIPRLLLAYSMGIFPWYPEGAPILWWSPDPRLVLFPEELKISRSLRQTLNRGIFETTIDQAFDDVIARCAEVRRKNENGTWITRDMNNAYVRLHRAGHAHSIETWHGGKLVGGLYGVALKTMFFGESMFHTMRDASKVALVRLAELSAERGYELIDCQVTTQHLLRMGAREIPRAEFLSVLRGRNRQGQR